ncbi:MAG: HEPN domain-containing protein [Planctomycetia bacterium]|nr:HEPN domain-containing protein [Planctomycetia bacterium]
MSPEEARASVIAWSVERARVRLAAAERELEAGVPQLAADHAYYACFHLLSAIFLHEGLTLKRHSAVRSALHERLIQTGRLDRPWGGIFDRLAELRTKSVYAALFTLDPAAGRAVVDDAARLATELRRLLPPT